MDNNKADGTAAENKDAELDKILGEEGNEDGSDRTIENKPDESQKDPYQSELARLRAENAKQAEMIRTKNAAIEEQKQKLNAVKNAPKENTPAPKEDDMVEINGLLYKKHDVEAIKLLAREENNELRRLLADKEREDILNKTITNPSERELVKHHLENSVKSSGDIVKDINNARLLANQNVLLNSEESNQAMREEVLASLSSGVSSGRSKPERVDAATQQAADMLRQAGYGSAADKLLKRS